MAASNLMGMASPPVCVVLLVTSPERKAAEEALRESEARFRTVADQAPVMIWMSGTDKEGIFFNKGWLEFTGRTVDQELGEGWLKGVHPDDLTHCLDVCGTAFGKREPFTVEYRLRRNDGEYRWLLDSGTPRFEADGTFLGYIGSCIDIGERKQAELDHQRQSMELARVERVALLGELAASLAHEINNPVGAMVTNASAGQRLLARGQLGTAELRELLADIVSDGHRAREVIDGIRNMVRKSEASYSLVGMGDVIDDLLRIMRADAIARKINLVAEVDGNAGVVVGDRVQLLQVLLNLTMNAFDALDVVRADVRRVIIRAEPVKDGKICVSVRDTGPGFPDGIGEQLFEPFFSTKAEGTGMGLAIARSIVEAHGGTLSGENYPEAARSLPFACRRRNRRPRDHDTSVSATRRDSSSSGQRREDGIRLGPRSDGHLRSRSESAPCLLYPPCPPQLIQKAVAEASSNGCAPDGFPFACSMTTFDAQGAGPFADVRGLPRGKIQPSCGFSFGRRRGAVPRGHPRRLDARHEWVGSAGGAPPEIARTRASSLSADETIHRSGKPLWRPALLDFSQNLSTTKSWFNWFARLSQTEGLLPPAK